MASNADQWFGFKLNFCQQLLVTEYFFACMQFDLSSRVCNGMIEQYLNVKKYLCSYVIRDASHNHDTQSSSHDTKKHPNQTPRSQPFANRLNSPEYVSKLRSVHPPKMQMCGGHSQAKEANPAIQRKVMKIKESVEAKLGAAEPFDQFEATQYRSQIVAGTIWHFKVKVTDTKAYHMRVFEPLPYTGDPMEIQALEEKGVDDPLETMAPKLR